MPLQNRVDPFGEIHAVPQRGLFTGNRGVIHDPATRTLVKRRWSTRAWLICECAFQGRRRKVMGRNSRFGTAGWTELFFLDEVTALAAGHRPCFHCRRERAQAFMANLSVAEGSRLTAPALDRRLHRERSASGGRSIAIDAGEIENLPDGAMVCANDRAYAVRGGKLLAWSFGGYGDPLAADHLHAAVLRVLTPQTTVGAMRAGYRALWHSTAL